MSFLTAVPRHADYLVTTYGAVGYASVGYG